MCVLGWQKRVSEAESSGEWVPYNVMQELLVSCNRSFCEAVTNLIRRARFEGKYYGSHPYKVRSANHPFRFLGYL